MGRFVTSRDVEQAFLGSLQVQTGQCLEEWMALVAKCGLDERSQIVQMLKDRFRLPHLSAQLIAGIFLNRGEPVYGPASIPADCPMPSDPN